MNKGLLISALVVFVVLSACTKTIVDVPPQEEGYPIIFDDARTKTLITENTFTAFRVWGETSPGTADVFNSVEVLRSDQASSGRSYTWTYEGSRYWYADKDYYFYAISPADRSLTYTDGDYCFDYTMPETISSDLESDSDHIDIVVASEKRRTGTLSSAPPAVSLDFSHVLSRINVQLSKSSYNNNQEIAIRNIYLRGMKGSGTYGFAYGWTLSDEVVTASLLDVSGMDFPSNTSRNYLVSILAVPQTLSADQVYLIVEYEYTHSGGTSFKTLNVALPVSVVSEWNAGESVTYSAEIHVDQYIQIATPVVEPWGSEQQGGIIIIR